MAYFKALREDKRRKMFHRRLNGKLVSDWTGLEGKELGQFMTYLNRQFPDKASMVDAVLAMKDTQSWVVDCFQRWREETGQTQIPTPSLS